MRLRHDGPAGPSGRDVRRGRRPGGQAVALELASAIGFDAYDAGPLANARVLEDMVRVWRVIAEVHGRTAGFAISRG